MRAISSGPNENHGSSSILSRPGDLDGGGIAVIPVKILATV
jgi:hypothetical protein